MSRARNSMLGYFMVTVHLSKNCCKCYRSTDGLEIWVGRSDEGNDYMTTRLARGNDLFFHLEGAPGSHVILRTEGRADPPPLRFWRRASWPSTIPGRRERRGPTCTSRRSRT